MSEHTLAATSPLSPVMILTSTPSRWSCAIDDPACRAVKRVPSAVRIASRVWTTKWAPPLCLATTTWRLPLESSKARPAMVLPGEGEGDRAARPDLDLRAVDQGEMRLVVVVAGEGHGGGDARGLTGAALIHDRDRDGRRMRTPRQLRCHHPQHAQHPQQQRRRQRPAPAPGAHRGGQAPEHALGEAAIAGDRERIVDALPQRGAGLAQQARELAGEAQLGDQGRAAARVGAQAQRQRRAPGGIQLAVAPAIERPCQLLVHVSRAPPARCRRAAAGAGGTASR